MSSSEDIHGVRDLRLEVCARNNVLYRAIFDRWPTVAAFCRKHGFSQSLVGLLLNLKTSPRTKYGGWRETATSLAALFRMLPEDLFPARLYDIETPFVSLELAAPALQAPEDELLAIAAPEEYNPERILELSTIQTTLEGRVRRVLSELSPREEKVLRMRFGIGESKARTCQEVGEDFGVSPERIRQIESKALKKLRRPTKSRILKGKEEDA